MLFGLINKSCAIYGVLGTLNMAEFSPELTVIERVGYSIV